MENIVIKSAAGAVFGLTSGLAISRSPVRAIKDALFYGFGSLVASGVFEIGTSESSFLQKNEAGTSMYVFAPAVGAIVVSGITQLYKYLPKYTRFIFVLAGRSDLSRSIMQTYTTSFGDLLLSSQSPLMQQLLGLGITFGVLTTIQVGKEVIMPDDD